MPRYVVRTIARRRPVRSDDGDPVDFALLPDLTVYEDPEPVRTGLLNAHGNSLYRVADRAPMGFRGKVKR